MNDNVCLRDVEAGDLAAFFEHQRDPDAVRMAAFPARDAEAFAAHWAKILADETAAKKTILCGAQVAGNVLSWEQLGDRYVGYWVGKSFWGKGVATRALAAFLEHVRARPLFARVAKANVASLRVLAKCGFTIVGEDREAAPTGGEAVEEFVLMLGTDANASSQCRSPPAAPGPAP
jgi:RimJ/RimL family protein N-acetyltransferase